MHPRLPQEGPVTAHLPGTTCIASVGAGDLTDAPNFGTKFGWRKPCPRYIGPSKAPLCKGSWHGAAVTEGLSPPNGRGRGCRATPAGFPPPFSFCGGKKKTAVEPSKEKTLIAAQLRARDAPCRAAGCGSKRSCSVIAASAGTRAGLSSDFRTFCAVLHSEVIGQRLNLTSFSFRAFRFAKRCPGSRGGLPFRSVGADAYD